MAIKTIKPQTKRGKMISQLATRMVHRAYASKCKNLSLYASRVPNYSSFGNWLSPSFRDAGWDSLQGKMSAPPIALNLKSKSQSDHQVLKFLEVLESREVLMRVPESPSRTTKHQGECAKDIFKHPELSRRAAEACERILQQSTQSTKPE